MSENNYISFTWAIHNFSKCWQKCEEAIVSPLFCIYMPEKTKWKLLLYPRGMAAVNDSISIFLHRDKKCEGAENIRVEYCLDILDTDGSGVDDMSTFDEFQKDVKRGYPRYTTREIVPQYLQQDILTIRCKVIRLDGEVMNMRQIFARTIIGIENRIFVCPIENFSNLVPNWKQSFVFKAESNDVKIQINLALTNDNKENIRFSIISYGRYMKFSAVEIFISTNKKQKVYCDEYDCWFEFGLCSIHTLALTKRDVIKNKRLYLSKDVLDLHFQLTFSTGFAFEGIETDAWECTSHPCLKEMTEDRRDCIDHALSDCPFALIRDLTSLYADKSTCDMNLKTKTHIFPVHALILSARSPVFKDIFSKNIEVKIKGCVHESDFDDATVRRFLIYLYSDQLENHKWDDALELYKAADKYKVFSLKEKCYLFLKNNLNFENACKALIYSDLQCDRELKEVTQNFMLKNAKVIFKSEEWKILAVTNSKLALETTLQNWNGD